MRYWIERGHQEAVQPLGPGALADLDRLDAALNAPAFRHVFVVEPGDLPVAHAAALVERGRLGEQGWPHCHQPSALSTFTAFTAFTAFVPFVIFFALVPFAIC